MIGVDRRAAMKPAQMIELVTLEILGQRRAAIGQLLEGEATGGSNFLVRHGGSRQSYME